MSASSTGWFRWHRREAPVPPPAYPRIVSADEEPPAAPAEFDPFAFDTAAPANWLDARIEEVLPARVTAARDVLWLALRATWPPEHPIARALAAAWQEQTGVPPPQPVGIWHLSAGRGIQGYLSSYQVLIGNEQLMRDSGIALPESVRAGVAEYAARGWQAVFVGARSSPPEREDLHSSLIGVLALAPGGRTEEPTGEPVDSSPPAASTPALERNSAPPKREAPSDQPPPRRRRRTPWRLIGTLAILSAAFEVYESASTVAPDEVAIVRRFGRVVSVCAPGLHFRTLWPVERIARIRPHGTRLLQLEWGGIATCERHVRAAVEYRIGEQDADRIAYACAPTGADGLFARIAEATLRESLAAPAVEALSVDWRRRMDDRLATLPLGLVVINAPIFTIEPIAATAPSEAGAIGDPVAQATAAAKQSVKDAQAQARKTLADARADANTRAEAVQEAGRLIARCGGPGTSLDAARLKLINEAMDGRLPGRRSTVIDPTLGASCRMYLLKGSGLQTASLWIWPASQPAAPVEGRP